MGALRRGTERGLKTVAGLLGLAATIAAARWALGRMRYLAEYGGDDGA